MNCDHKFIDSKRCLKCGWEPPNSVFVFTRFNGNGYTARIGKLTATCTAGERQAVERVAKKHFGVAVGQAFRLDVVPVKECHIKDGIGWQPGSWTAERKS